MQQATEQEIRDRALSEALSAARKKKAAPPPEQPSLAAAAAKAAEAPKAKPEDTYQAKGPGKDKYGLVDGQVHPVYKELVYSSKAGKYVKRTNTVSVAPGAK
jgi:hypothetical protein